MSVIFVLLWLLCVCVMLIWLVWACRWIVRAVFSRSVLTAPPSQVKVGPVLVRPDGLTVREKQIRRQAWERHRA